MSEKKKVALVTGAAGSMGFATTKALLDDGYAVVMGDLDANKLKTLAAPLGRDAHPLAFDVSDFKQVEAAVRRAESEVGPIDVLVNNAGILSNNKVAETTPDEWRRVLAINLDGAFYLSKLILPGMKARRWGRIVNTCSYAMKSGGVTAGTAYTVSKGALQALTFSLARECTAFGVTVNGIAPAHVRTPMVTEQLTKEQQEKMIAMIPVGRFCEPEEFAHCVRFFVSPLAGFITGEILDLNGGLQFD
ncbi:MAG TPA: SDR family NAD(P)-dependent oxidoreductase [Alphaproteobacteria bacterium]|nr:SDR family NAD(P)-dependent oxidoreductase [Alphaproteobacteria bacterium]